MIIWRVLYKISISIQIKVFEIHWIKEETFQCLMTYRIDQEIIDQSVKMRNLPQVQSGDHGKEDYARAFFREKKENKNQIKSEEY